MLGIYISNYTNFRGIINKKHLINRTWFSFSIEINRTTSFKCAKNPTNEPLQGPCWTLVPWQRLGSPSELASNCLGRLRSIPLLSKFHEKYFQLKHWNLQKFLGHAYGWQFLDGPRPKGYVESMGNASRKRKTTVRFTSKGNRAVDLEGSWPSKHITVYVLYVPDFCNTKIMCTTPAWREMYHQSRNKRDNFSSTLNKQVKLVTIQRRTKPNVWTRL